VLAAQDLKAFVHAGTSSEYGNNCSGPSEDSPRIPNSHYAVSKAAVADYIKYAGMCRKIPCLNLCLYSVYGPLEDTSRLIPVLLRNAINNKLPAFVDARISRDFIHIDDVCDIFILAAAKMNPEIYGHSFNIGSGKATTIIELAEITRQVFNISELAKFGTMEGRSWDLANWYSNPVKANTLFNWRAKIELAEGLKKTANWVASLSDDDMRVATKNK
jgi:dolichol-phosphate mannosyltransferase